MLQAFHRVANPILELLPRRPVELVAQFPVIVHFPPAISSPLASGHVDHKIPILLFVVDPRVLSIVSAGARGKAVDLPLRDEGRVGPDPRLIGVQIFERVLLLVLPLHVLLLVGNGIPPYVQQTIGPSTAANEEGTKVKAATILRDDEVDGLRFVVPRRGTREWV